MGARGHKGAAVGAAWAPQWEPHMGAVSADASRRTCNVSQQN